MNLTTSALVGKSFCGISHMLFSAAIGPPDWRVTRPCVRGSPGMLLEGALVAIVMNDVGGGDDGGYAHGGRHW